MRGFRASSLDSKGRCRLPPRRTRCGPPIAQQCAGAKHCLRWRAHSTEATMDEPRSPTPIECPECQEILPESPSGSMLASVRCASCGHMLSFDEVLALREAEQARARRYE